jgi:hypothetical protein
MRKLGNLVSNTVPFDINYGLYPIYFSGLLDKFIENHHVKAL